ncbi:MAG: hypothetical protein KAH26_03945 [Bacteroidales bacterium]|nr:hypothetical protein [Bacteroidales bacterium]
MKRTAIIILIFVVNMTFIRPVTLQAQCTNCRGAISNPERASSAIGIMTKASGVAAFASGYYAIASGEKTSSIGSNIQADGDHSMVLGSNANSLGERSMIIGHGFGEYQEDRLFNNINNSLMIGFNSIYPTLFIGKSHSKYRTGSIGIGNVTDPEAKLHIRNDQGEIVGLFIEQPNFRITEFYLGTKDHGLRSTDDHGLIFRTPKNYVFDDGKVGINTYYPHYDLDVQGSIFSKKLTLFDENLYLENIEGWVLRANAQGNAYWTDPAMLNDNDWIIIGNSIHRIAGTVGIGTSDTYGYKLAVNGAIITEEVTVKVSEDWPDYVFNKDYALLPLQQLESYIESNRHLPGIPSAEDIRDEGLRLGEMERLLLKKIEELTLYIIQQDYKMEELETRLDVFVRPQEFK